jgi:hypothetical protein
MNTTLLNLYKQTAEINNLTEEQVKAVVEEFWYSIRQQISNTQGHDILIHHLGNFEIPKGMLDKYIEAIQKSYEKGNMVKSKYDKGLENLKRIKELRGNES